MEIVSVYQKLACFGVAVLFTVRLMVALVGVTTAASVVGFSVLFGAICFALAD